ncbi:Zn-dependent hydrolase [Cupriavidus sp. 30B13]|uniref:Zn-dependent hydrolase n=1 Tax=Cupriavidus sp. 30B13 TaxID=3384241 RepID=UPI003B91F6C7
MDIEALKPVAQTLFDDIRTLSFDGVGVTRDSYGAGESAAADYLRDFARREGLHVEADGAANLVFRLPGERADVPAAWIGSHLDSVPQGGNFDGLAGVVAGLLCLLARRRAGGATAAPLGVIGLRGEESAWFGKAYLGSGAALGKLGAGDLALRHRRSGHTVAECMAALGADLASIRAQRPLFDKTRALAYLELHIEQGPVMVARGLPLAVVPGIRGNVRHNRITCSGEAGHSGAVPRWLRKDAMFAVAELIVRLDTRWRELLERGADLVVTTGVVGTSPEEHSVSRIPGTASFSFEARSKSVAVLEEFYRWMRAECEAVARERGVCFAFDARVDAAPATMDAGLSELLARQCRARGVPFDLVPSGAGHDAAQFANAGIPTGMLFIRNEHGSHNPREAMDLDDFMLGVGVLAAAVDSLRSGGVSEAARGSI